MPMPAAHTGAAVITGAATSTGSAIAVSFARNGCLSLYLGDNTWDGLLATRNAVREAVPSAHVYLEEFQQSSEEEVNQFFAKVATTLPRIDFAVNIVSQPQEPGTNLSVPTFDRNFHVYQRGAFLIQRALLRQMLRQDVLPASDGRGSIVNVTDHGPTPTLANFPVVAAVASAIIGMSKTDACGYAPDKIRVNCVAASEVMMEKHGFELAGGVPLPRKGQPQDVANAVLWLSSTNSSWLTGLVVAVDGGRSLHHLW